MKVLTPSTNLCPVKSFMMLWTYCNKLIDAQSDMRRGGSEPQGNPGVTSKLNDARKVTDRVRLRNYPILQSCRHNP